MNQQHYEYVQEQLRNAAAGPQSQYAGKSGIYAIYCDDKIVYIGKSTNLLTRFIAHQAHIFCPYADEYNRPKYRELRRALSLGHDIKIEVLIYCSKQELNKHEREQILKYLPALNTQIPNAATWYNKHIAQIC